MHQINNLTHALMGEPQLTESTHRPLNGQTPKSKAFELICSLNYDYSELAMSMSIEIGQILQPVMRPPQELHRPYGGNEITIKDEK